MEEASKLFLCKCGAGARIRYREPFTWVECRKKCGIVTHQYYDCDEPCDRESRRLAINEWNRMVKQNE